jgi:hypothetical protein
VAEISFVTSCVDLQAVQQAWSCSGLRFSVANGQVCLSTTGIQVAARVLEEFSPLDVRVLVIGATSLQLGSPYVQLGSCDS